MEATALGPPAASESARGSQKTRQRGRKGAHRAGPAAERQPLQQPSGGLALTVAGAAAGLLVSLLGRALRGVWQRSRPPRALTAVATANAAPLVCLPADILGNILQSLSVQDRLCLLVTCRQLHQMSTELGSVLWRDTQVRLPRLRQMQQFSESLAAAAPYVRRLKVFAAFPAANARVAGDIVGFTAATIDAAGALAAAVARAPSLETLIWDVCGTHATDLARWAQPGALPLLRSLTLICHHELEVPWTLRIGLPALRELHIIEDVFGPDHTRPYEDNGSGIRLAPGCLPAGLQLLEIVAAGKFKLPRATIAGCTRLSRLSISCCGQPMLVPATEIMQLRGLRQLRVGDYVPSIRLLGSLAQLMQLTALDCSAAFVRFQHSSAESSNHVAITRALQALAANPPARLRELNLGRFDLLSLPQTVLTIPSLEVLHLDRNPYVQLGGGQAELEWCSLRHITLEAAAIQRNLELLRCMPKLCAMHISFCGPTTEDDRSALYIIESDEAGFKNAVAVCLGHGPTLTMGRRAVDILQESYLDRWCPNALSRQQRLAEERAQARARGRAAVVGQGVVGTAVGAATGAAVHFVQRLCTP